MQLLRKNLNECSHLPSASTTAAKYKSTLNVVENAFFV